MKNLALMASGKGSNVEKLLEKSKELSHISVKVIITDQANAGVLDIAKKYRIPFEIVECKDLGREQHEKKILTICKKFHIEWVLLAGYMRILSSEFLNAFTQDSFTKIINIHPSLLPAYKGLNAFERAFNDQVSESGVTIHYVDKNVDEGKVILQKSFPRKNTDTLHDFIKRGQSIEHLIYPQVLEKLNNNTLHVMRSK